MSLSTSMLSRLQTQHESLQGLISGLSKEQLKKRVNPEKWSAWEQIAHITAYQPTFLLRMQNIEAKDGPLFERYIADNDLVFHQYIEFSLPEILDELHTRRFLINNYISRLSEGSLRREGIHPLYGRFNVSRWVEFFLLHEAHHLFSIFMLTAALRASQQQ